MIVLLIVLYIIIGCIVGSVYYVFYDYDETVAFFVGFIWIIILPIALIYIIAIKNVINILEYVKHNGFHYYKKDIQDCCGKCKHVQYPNIYYDNTRCLKHNTKIFKIEQDYCNSFKKDFL